MWFREDECEKVIKSQRQKYKGFCVYSINKTLGLLGKDLMQQNKTKTERVDEVIKTNIDDLEYIRLRFPNEETIDKELELTNKLEEYLIKQRKRRIMVPEFYRTLA